MPHVPVLVSSAIYAVMAMRGYALRKMVPSDLEVNFLGGLFKFAVFSPWWPLMFCAVNIATLLVFVRMNESGKAKAVSLLALANAASAYFIFLLYTFIYQGFVPAIKPMRVVDPGFETRGVVMASGLLRTEIGAEPGK